MHNPIVELSLCTPHEHPIMLVAFGLGRQDGTPIDGYEFDPDPADEWKGGRQVNYTGVVFFNN